MDVLFCGTGSIGKRHIKNLKSITDVNIYALKSSSGVSKQSDAEIGISRIDNTGDINSLDLSFICNPTVIHADTAIKIIKKFNCPLFIEKPIDSNLEKADELVNEIKKKKIMCMVGYMMRYNHSLNEVKKLIQGKTLGNVVEYNMSFHTYFPDWHPNEDYRISYAGRKDLGGGVILTLIHEIDMAYWLFGDVEKVMCSSGHASNLEIDVEDYADISFKHRNGIQGKIHLDYCTKKPSRNMKIVFEQGIVEWDFFACEVVLYQSNKKQIVYKNNDKDYINNMYVDMLKDFLFRIENKKKIEINEDVGLYTLKLALLAKKSAEQGKEFEV